MKKKNTDTFEGIEHNSVNMENFFLQGNLTEVASTNSFASKPSRRLNDFDSKILEEDAYKDLSDELFKLEYKISKLEKQLEFIDNQIQSAREIADYDLIEKLYSQKKIITTEYSTLISIYKEKSISANISNKILNFFSKKMNFNLNKLQLKMLRLNEFIERKIPKHILSVLELRKSLTKLENLNKSVDELMSMTVPYGEDFNKYEQLSKYIIKANTIQADISKQIRK